MYSSSDFNNLRDAGFDDTYSCVESAMRFYNSDPITCCGKFRQALEASIVELCGILNKQIEGDLIIQINKLNEYIPRKFRSDKLVEEMHILRTIGNKYAHFSNEERNPETDRLTCYCAMKNVSEWMVNFSIGYPEYLKEEEQKRKEEEQKRKEEEQKRKEEEQKRKERFGKVLKPVVIVVAAVAAIAGAVFAGRSKN